MKQCQMLRTKQRGLKSEELMQTKNDVEKLDAKVQDFITRAGLEIGKIATFALRASGWATIRFSTPDDTEKSMSHLHQQS